MGPNLARYPLGVFWIVLARANTIPNTPKGYLAEFGPTIVHVTYERPRFERPGFEKAPPDQNQVFQNRVLLRPEYIGRINPDGLTRPIYSGRVNPAD